MKVLKNKFKAIFIGTFFVGIIFSKMVFATELDINYTNSYIYWNNLTSEEKENSYMPKLYEADVPEDILYKYKNEKNIFRMVSSLLGNNNRNLENVFASYLDSEYNLADEFNIKVKNQGITQECWATSMTTLLETNIGKKEKLKELPDFSERHMDYATSKTFLNNEINNNGFDREVGNGGLPVIALAYLTNGQGAVLEQDMPFENNENKISLNQINKNVDTIATGYAILPSILKEYDSNGNIKYFNNNGKVYTLDEVKAIRNLIKQHIIEYGAVSAMTAASFEQFYNYDRTDGKSNILNSTAYFCNDSSIIRDHALTIVGWDDNYSRDNFNENCKPQKNGAYIVLNSYGSNSFNNGYMYVSYEDVLIESEMYSITNNKKKDYDNIYQYDYYGGIVPIGTKELNEGYYATLFDRETNKNEILNNVGITIPEYVDIEIYVNPKGSSMNKASLIKVGETKNLEPGYHRIDITPTKLTGKEFAVVIKQKSNNERFYFSVEANIPKTPYSVVNSEGKSYVSIDGNNWQNLSYFNISGFDMSKSDVCIKAFTVEDNSNPENDHFEINKYRLDNNFILNIEYETKISDFLNKINTNMDLKILSNDNKEVTDRNEKIKTGMILRLSNNEEYILVVRGDINCDGKVSLIDLSKLICHYNEEKGKILTGYQAKAADLSLDGRISILDLSQLIVLYNSI